MEHDVISGHERVRGSAARPAQYGRARCRRGRASMRTVSPRSVAQAGEGHGQPPSIRRSLAIGPSAAVQLMDTRRPMALIPLIALNIGLLEPRTLSSRPLTVAMITAFMTLRAGCLAIARAGARQALREAPRGRNLILMK